MTENGTKDGGGDELAVLRRERKRRQEAAKTFRDNGRPELADAEESESALIEAYMPAELSDDELQSLVVAAVAESGAESPRDMGRVMPLVMERTGGRADGKRVSALVRQALS